MLFVCSLCVQRAACAGHLRNFSKFKNQFIRERVRTTLTRGIRDGHFRENINIDILATLRVEEVEMGFDNDVFPHASFTLEQVQMQLFDHFIFGLLTPEGMLTYQSRKKNFTVKQ